MPATTDPNKLSNNQLNNQSGAGGQHTTQTEKPLHYQYLKEFRCEQCPLFLQHKCTQHKPFTCFYWHFCNQRRRRPIRKRDGTFNYSPDVYCTKYDETTGVCPEGDDCQYLHRTAGDTERRYHLRYYKTGICVYDTDSRGYCVKNGPHCAFAHGLHDLRNPVYDIRELQAMESGQQSGQILEEGNGIGLNNSSVLPNSLDKERNALNEDPRWQDTAYVLANYKTELCKRPPRLCRQGYACPQFHNNKDRRRSPKKFKYRSTPCPNVKQGDEWGDPANCENSDGCPYCHTRTEQQFHPEIYKSTKCNDIQQTGYCPRGPFCAFAHIETSEEISAARELSMEGTTDLSALVSNVLPPTNNCNTSPVPISRTNSMSSQQTSNSAHNRNQQSVASSLPDHYQTGGFDLSAPQPPPQHQQHRDIPTPSGLGPIARPRSFSTSTATQQSSDSFLMSYLNEKKNGPSLNANTSSLFSGTSSPLFANLRESAFGLQSSASESNSFYNPIDAVLNQTLDDLNLDDIHMEANSGSTGGQNQNNISDNHENNAINSLGMHRSSGLLGASQPVTIPGARLGNANTNLSSNLSPPVGASPLTSSLASGPGGHGFGVSPFLHRNNSVGQSSLYDYTSASNMSPGAGNGGSNNPSSIVASMMEVQRLREENSLHKATLANYEEKLAQAMNLWKREVEEVTRKEKLAESQRDEALSRLSSIQKELELLKCSENAFQTKRLGDLSSMTANQLIQLQNQTRSELKCIEEALIRHQNTA